MKNKLLFIILTTSIFFNYNSSIAQNLTTLQEGDLLFQHLNCGALCDAIETVTSGVNGKKFSHCAIVVKQNDSLKVVEAIGENVQLSSIYNFFKRSNDTALITNITIARLKKDVQIDLNKALRFVIDRIGEAYDDEFILNNKKWYCSELLYEAFKSANNNKDFFLLTPMTFKKPNSNKFFPAWIEYYKTLKKPIPEGLLGINPGSISRSDKLTIIDIKALQVAE